MMPLQLVVSKVPRQSAYPTEAAYSSELAPPLTGAIFRKIRHLPSYLRHSLPSERAQKILTLIEVPRFAPWATARSAMSVDIRSVMNVKNEVTHYFYLADDPYEMHDRPGLGAQRGDLKKLPLEWHRKAGGEGGKG